MESCNSLPVNSNDIGHQMFINQHVGDDDGQHCFDIGNTRNPLEMIDIVNLLVKYLDGRSLKSALMVSKTWNVEGMKFFFKNNFITIPKKLSFSSEQEEIDMINRLKTSFSRSTSFPNAFIKNPHDIEILQKHNILSELKHVKVDLENCWEDQIECVETILEECRHLTFLQNSEFTNGYRLIKKCVETGKNESFTIFKLHVNFHNWDESFQTTENFIKSGVKIINLVTYDTTVNNEDTIFPNLIEKMLYSSKDCIKQLNVADCTSSFSLANNVPLMLQLESLIVNIKPQPLTPGLPVPFPHGFRFDNNCPNLKRFNISFDTDTENSTHNYMEQAFSSTGPPRSVKHLDVFTSGQFQLDHLIQTFSEIETLDIKCSRNLDLTPLWKSCIHLQSLTISLYGYQASDYIKLLAHMTGHSKDYITSVWSSSNIKILPLPGQPSLLELQDLETLTFRGGIMVEGKTKFLNLLRSFALPNMPKLKKIE